MEIGYTRFDGLYRVTLMGKNQRLVTNGNRFARITGVDPKVLSGCMSVTADVARSIGFIIPEEVSVHADVRSAEPVAVIA